MQAGRRRKKGGDDSDSSMSEGEAAKQALRQEPVAAFLDPTENELDDEVERILGHR